MEPAWGPQSIRAGKGGNAAGTGRLREELAQLKTVVPSKGLEPPHPCEYMDLNHARLPIPPRWQKTGMRPSAPGRVPGRTTSNILQGYSRLSNSGERYSRQLYSGEPYSLDPRSAATENFAKPSEAITSLRILVHDLSNSLDTVLQAAYLLQEAKLDGKNKKWAQTIDAAARNAARINREINAILKSQR